MTYAAGLRVPSPLGDRLLLRVLRETRGHAGSASEEAIADWTRRLATATGIDAAPEGGCALSVLRDSVMQGTISINAEVVVFNTGSGASYRGVVTGPVYWRPGGRDGPNDAVSEPWHELRGAKA